MVEHNPKYLDKKYRVDIEKIIEDKDIIVVDNRKLGGEVVGMTYLAGGYNVFSVCPDLNSRERKHILAELYYWNKFFNHNRIIKNKDFNEEDLFRTKDNREKKVVEKAAKLLIPKEGIYEKIKEGWPEVNEYADHFDVTVGMMKTRLHLENIIYEEQKIKG